jgi:hypothetical protein
VISISAGTFPHWSDYSDWCDALARAEAQGVTVMTCSREFLCYGSVEWIPGTDRDDPMSYRHGTYCRGECDLLIPTCNRTTASPTGPNVYTFWRDGGLSWTAPYLAGLAALAYQVNPSIKPARIRRLLVETAHRTEIGPVVNPPAFIEAAKGVV